MKHLTPPLRLALTVALSIFAIEMVIMSLLPSLHLESPWIVTILDSSMLVVTLVPILYAFVLRPMQSEMSARVTAEHLLREANAQLETRVGALRLRRAAHRRGSREARGRQSA